jgi:hypothetical protein
MAECLLCPFPLHVLRCVINLFSLPSPCFFIWCLEWVGRPGMWNPRSLGLESKILVLGQMVGPDTWSSRSLSLGLKNWFYQSGLLIPSNESQWVLVECQSPGLNANSQTTKAGFWGKQTKRRTGRVNLSKLCCPTSKRKCLLFKGDFRGLSLSMWQNVCPRMGASLSSPGL